MILDGLLVLDDTMTTTTSCASTNVINTVAAGDSYEGAWFVVQIDTSFTATGAPTTVFQLQTSDLETFLDTDDVTLCQTASTLVAGLTAGTRFAIRIPPGAKKYIRGYKSITNYSAPSIAVTASAYSMFIVKDIDMPVSAPNVKA